MFVSYPADSMESRKSRRPAFFFAAIVLFALGAVSFYGLTWEPVELFIQAKHWMPVPCKVLSFSIQETTKHPTERDKISKRLELLYQYTYKGVVYQSDWFYVMKTDVRLYTGLALIFEAHRESKEITCYVNPANPSQAVLLRDFQPCLLLSLLSPVFVLGGVWCLCIGIHDKRRPRVFQDEAGAPATASLSDSIFFLRESSHTFKPQQSSAQQAVSLLIFVIIWNSAVSISVIQAVGKFREGRQDWMQMLFLVPLAGVGLLLILLFFHTFFGIGNPIPSIALEPAKFGYGSSVLLSWNWQGKAGRVQKLKITLTGRQLFYQRAGASIFKKENEFFRMPLVETDDPLQIVSGQTAFVMPDRDIPKSGDLMWTIEIHGRVKFWSDVSEKLIIMSPRQPTSSS
jgi:predicted membrane protein